MTKMTMVVDLDRCIGCYACEIACKQENDVNLGSYWNKVQTMGPYGDFPHVEMYFLPTMCQHCSSPTCVSVCPTGATYQRDEDGIVLIDREKCIGCQYCAMACPYGARTFNKKQKVVEKCTLCVHLQAVGEKPACVKCCTAEARIFGDAEDPASDVSKALAEAGADAVHSMPDVGNNPSVKYILHSKTATWKELI
ncbi:4Fe-4S dicluster domain-containing protein [Eggerthella sinensis]|uniref:4Fe-4S ferredoxin n=1 Tax=Eggerthella sinensis TaxID=242230 RepID=A0A3N0IWW2_9ACTN|nr:4Fe-4S dicluster domain-containing protein [Eggerthella sinensis]RDB70721.1 4Fe-4S ferredoxin [Eggerthella sinensis]RNM41481.1 4Fe-4S ferredoxin [Eggerthella sinensis]